MARFLSNGRFVAELNRTFIVMIPKRSNAAMFDDYRPISLCNTTYKIISKLLSNRIRKVLQNLISPNQSAFVKGRWIAENSIIAHEFQVLLNGGLTKSFAPRRGIRQGDPLSPYIFILCSEVLSRLLFAREESGSLEGVKVSRHGPAISHLICQLLRSEIVNSFGFKEMNEDEQFLGNPLFIHGNCVSKFKNVVDKVASRLEGWKAKLLSQSARSVLIQNVLQTVPLYSMAVFKLPVAIHNELDGISRRFWWTRDTGKSRYLSLVSWDSICKPKACGGLGFRKSGHNNICLLAKLAWMLAKEGDALWIKVLKGKYFPQTSFLAAGKKQNSSLVARGIWDAKQLIKDHAAWRVSFNSSRNLWDCDWVVFDGLRIGQGDLNPLESKSLFISDLVDRANGAWDLNSLSLSFSPKTVVNFQLIYPSDLASQDSLVWTASPSGEFSLKSAYWALKVLAAIFGNELGPCCLCDSPDANSTAHLFGDCDVVKKLWFLSKWGIRIEAFDLSDGRKVLHWMFNAPFIKDLEARAVTEFRLFAAVLFCKAWFFRNQAFHNGGSMPVELMSKLVGREFDSQWSLLSSNTDAFPSHQVTICS
ncbi:uncharacterized protein LOC133034093 [Cannabis sativa]|uniref:uncharacterized protein LOC133034093 n=1 Tax=Cannabis sativa TaxID=3483 RepID=UPI0029CA2BF6|nr:uncharacterized protein LOC133034093 [Cannabis sativa]